MLLRDLPAERAQLQAALRETAGWAGGKSDKTLILDELLGTINHDSFPGAIVPRLRQGAMVYYMVTETDEQWRNLQPLMRAFVGMTLTDFSGRPAELDAADPFEKLLADSRFATVARFSAHGCRSLEVNTVNALLLLLHGIEQGLRPRAAVPPSTAAVLYEFRMALAVGDRPRADWAIGFLRDNLRLDALNLHFLEVQRDAEFDEWETLRSRTFFGSLCLTRRPPKVTSALAEALYRTELMRFEEANDPDGALEFFRSAVLPQYGGLLSHCPTSPRPAVVKLFMLAVVAAPTMDRQLLESLLKASGGFAEAERAYVDRIVGLMPPVDQATPIADLPGTAQYLRQLELANDAVATIDGAKAVLAAAINVQSLEAYRISVDYVMRLSPTEQQSVVNSPFFGDIWSRIAQFTGKQNRVPHSWREWAESLDELSFSESRAFAEQAAEEWPIAEHLSSPQEVKALATALEIAATASEERVLDALPHLVTWVCTDEAWPNTAYKGIYDTILNLLLLSSSRSNVVLSAILMLLDGQLSIGMSMDRYREILIDLCDMVGETASVRTADWLLDMAELTIIHPCPDPAARMSFWSAIAADLGPLRGRMKQEQIGLGYDLAMTLGVPETFPQPPQPAEPGAAEGSVSDAVVAIYTLAEGVAERATRVLAPLYPNLHFEVFSDQVATPRLQQYARTADLFVVCWTRAKHAATLCIRGKRPSNAATVWAQGGGSSSVVQAVGKYFAESALRAVRA